jgi:Flp pilus assembly pilin Flp
MRRLLTDESGQGLVEYALILSCISLLVIGALHALGHRASMTLADLARHLDGPSESESQQGGEGRIGQPHATFSGVH